MENQILEVFTKLEKLAPELIEQKIAWATACNFWGIVIALVVAAICLAIVGACIKSKDPDNDTVAFISVAFGFFALVFAIALHMENVKIKKYPDLYVVESLLSKLSD